MDPQSAVQQLLLDQGVYSPVELLLTTGLLAYSDYLAWRRGEIGSLDEALHDRSATRGLLESAQAFALKLGLTAEPVAYEGWEGSAGLDLRAASDRGLNALLRTHYRRVQKEGEEQLDLFLDSAATAAANDLLNGLLRRSTHEASRALARLLEISPDHAHVPHARSLVAALEIPVPTMHGDALERLDRMVDEWMPAASDLLAGRAQDFLRPLWQGIADALDPSRFEVEDAQRHVSWIHRQCLDWKNVRASVLAVPDYEAEPVLVERLAEAEWWLRDRAAAVGRWFALCALVPERMKAALRSPRFPDAAVKVGWEAAKAADVEPEITMAWLPAWMLLREPGLARILAPLGGVDGPARAFDLLLRLLTTEGDNIALREELAAVHRGLLDLFLATRG